MEKLTGTDMNELCWFFAEPPPAREQGHVAAQSYDPKGSGTYDPTQDMTLERLVAAAINRKPSEWDRINKVLVRVREGSGGFGHVEALRRAFDARLRVASLEGSFEYPGVALMTQTARSRGRDLAVDEEHTRIIEEAHQSAMLSQGQPGCSTEISRGYVAMRVLEAGARPVCPSEDLIHASTLRALARAVRDTDTEALAAIEAEQDALMAAAGAAYRVARRELGATKREAKAAEQKAKDADWESYITGKRAKEAARIDARLKRAS